MRDGEGREYKVTAVVSETGERNARNKVGLSVRIFLLKPVEHAHRNIITCYPRGRPAVKFRPVAAGAAADIDDRLVPERKVGEELLAERLIQRQHQIIRLIVIVFRPDVVGFSRFGFGLAGWLKKLFYRIDYRHPLLKNERLY